MAATYIKQSNKTWTVRAFWIDETGKRNSIQKSGFGSKKAATLWAEEKIETGKNSMYPDAHKVKLGDFLDDWIKLKEKTLSPTTISGYEVNIKKIKETLGNALLQNIRLNHIQKFINEQSEVVVRTVKHEIEAVDGSKKIEFEEIKAAPKTVKYTYRTLHAALEYAIKAGIIKNNPSDHVDLPSDRNFTPNILSAQDIVILINKLKECDHEIYMPVLLSVMHGLRRGEALGLRWCDIDFDNEIMHINNNYTVANGKNIYKGVKSKDSDAIIPVTKLVLNELNILKQNQSENGIIEKYICSLNGKMISPNALSKRLKSFQKANNLPICRFHDLRHSFANVSLDSGVDLDTLKRLMRHSKIGITSDLYLHNNTTREKAASNLFETALKNKSV